MPTIKERVDAEGRISIIKIISSMRIKPGDLIEIIPDKNKIILKIAEEVKTKGVFTKMAGTWANRPHNEIKELLDRAEREVLGFD